MEINKSERNFSEAKDHIYEVQQIVGIKKEGLRIPKNTTIEFPIICLNLLSVNCNEYALQ